jgi:adenylate cyclase, class 2
MAGQTTMAIMPIEIEAKIKVDKLDEYPTLLQNLGAVFQQESSQKDIFFDREGGELIRNHCGLRLRQETGPDRQKNQLCFKGPVQTASSLKQRQEIEFSVGDAAQAEVFLKALGFETMITVEKHRAVWRLEGCLVCLDVVEKLGCFVEIEGPDDPTIGRVAGRLGLDTRRHIPSSYAKMLFEQSHHGL